MPELKGRALLSGSASGPVLFLEEPLSFWGGVDHETGRIISVHHPKHGETVTGSILAMASGKGSSSSSSVFAELVRGGIAPAAVILEHADAILVIGAIVAEMLYSRRCPFLELSEPGFTALRDANTARIDRDVVIF